MNSVETMTGKITLKENREFINDERIGQTKLHQYESCFQKETVCKEILDVSKEIE